MSSLIAKKRLSAVKPSPTIAVTNKAMELKRQGIDVIGFGAGEPDFDTPENIKMSGIEAINNGMTRYTAVDGTPELKKAICDKFKRENNIDYLPSQITVGTGAKQVLYNAIMASVEEGDEVIIPAPYWVSYVDIVALAGGTPVVVNTKAEHSFKLTAEELKQAITPKTKWLILNSPSNPTGMVYTEEDIKKITDVVLEHDHVYILSDDIYEHIVFDDIKFVTPASVEPRLKDRIFTLNGVSKSYAMTGWRIGYGAGPVELIKAISTIQSQSTSNPSSISQYASVEALNGNQEFIAKGKEIFAKRRDLVVSLLNDIPLLSCIKPQGAFYAYPDCSKMFGKKTPKGKILQNSSDVAEYILEDALVAVVPGIAFGTEGFFRISYATSEELIKKGCERIKKACADLV